MSQASMEFCIFDGDELYAYGDRVEYSLIAYYKEWMTIYDSKGKREVSPYIEVAKDGEPCKTIISNTTLEYCRKMTDDEKWKAIKALNECGYTWNEGTLTLEKRENPKKNGSDSVELNLQSDNMYKKGDFIRMAKADFEFGIFEGKELSKYKYYNTNEYSLLAYYKRNKFVQNENGVWAQKPHFEISENGEPCKQSLNPCLSKFYSKMNESEKAQAIEVLHTYGYDWDEENLSIVKLGSNECVSKIAMQKFSYNGQIVKPMRRATIVKLRAALKKIGSSHKVIPLTRHSSVVYVYNKVTRKFELEN